METKSTLCDTIIDTYRNQLLTDAEIHTVSSKIFQYYTYRGKKTNTCIFCKQVKSRNEFMSKYNQKTSCRTLRIKCIHPTNPCKGWVYEYGVRFNLYKYVQDLSKRIDDIKTQIIINKNNLLYGYNSVSKSTQHHDKFIAEIKMETDIYQEALRDLLSYTENTQLNAEINTLYAKISEKIQEIKQYVGQSKFKEVSGMQQDIVQMYQCVNKLNSFIRSAETEQLIRLDKSHTSTDYVDDIEDAITDHGAPPKARSTRITKTREKSSKTPPVSKKATPTLLKKEEEVINNSSYEIISDIEDNINYVKLAMDKDFALMKSDKSLQEDLDVYMSVLKDNISKGTLDQQKEYAILLSKYEAFKSTDKPEVQYSDKMDEISDILNSAKMLLKDETTLLKSTTGDKEDLDVYMSLLKDDIANGAPDQQKEYAALLVKYEKFKSTQSSGLAKGVEPASSYLDAIEL